MADFITGILMENRASGIDPGAPGPPVERFLTIETSPGKTIEVFDSGVTTAKPISGDVPLGGTYHFLMSVRLDNMERAPFPPTPLPWKGPGSIEVWEGMIVDSDWTPPQQHYLCAFEGMEQSRWVVVDTPLGLAVTPPMSFTPRTPKPNERLRWRQSRFLLLAIWP